MTALEAVPVLLPAGERPLTTDERQACLWWLARQWDVLGPERDQMLTWWAHRGLGEDLHKVWAEYLDYAGKADALVSGEPWASVIGEDAGFRCQDDAAEWALDRAAEFMYALLEGES